MGPSRAESIRFPMTTLHLGQLSMSVSARERPGHLGGLQIELRRQSSAAAVAFAAESSAVDELTGLTMDGWTDGRLVGIFML